MIRKRKFKVDDKIMGTCEKGQPYNFTHKEWAGRVVEVMRDGWIRVQTSGGSDTWRVKEEHFELEEDLRLF